MIIQIIKSSILGLIPEVLYFTLFIIYAKNIKEKKIALGISIGIVYILCMFVQKYEYVYYFIFVVLIFLILKRLYNEKTLLVDIFLISLASLYPSILSLLYFTVSKYLDYYTLLVINRILLFLPFIFRKRLNRIYIRYCELWNRNDNEKRPIKSITLRIISLIVVCLLIYLINVTIINILKSIG